MVPGMVGPPEGVAQPWLPAEYSSADESHDWGGDPGSADASMASAHDADPYRVTEDDPQVAIAEEESGRDARRPASTHDADTYRVTEDDPQVAITEEESDDGDSAGFDWDMNTGYYSTDDDSWIDTITVEMREDCAPPSEGTKTSDPSSSTQTGQNGDKFFWSTDLTTNRTDAKSAGGYTN